jgi:hypothetical protein
VIAIDSAAASDAGFAAPYGSRSGDLERNGEADLPDFGEADAGEWALVQDELFDSSPISSAKTECLIFPFSCRSCAHKLTGMINVKSNLCVFVNQETKS